MTSRQEMNPGTIVLCLAAAVAATVAGATGAEHISGLTSSLWWLGAGAAVLAAAVALWPRGSGTGPRGRLVLAGGGVLAVAVMVLTAVLGLPHDLLVVIGWLLHQVTGAAALFQAEPKWLSVTVELILLTAALASLRLTLRDRRGSTGRCLSCGRDEAAAPASATARLRTLGALAALAPLPYLAIKLAWALGSDVGLIDRGYFAKVEFFTPGFADTVLLCGLGLAAAAGMALPVRQRWGRLGLGLVGVIGAAMLLPVGVIGAPALIAQLLGGGAWHSPIEFWVFAVVYASFLVWGLSLAPLTWVYLRSTRPVCPDHRPPPAGTHEGTFSPLIERTNR